MWSCTANQGTRIFWSKLVAVLSGPPATLAVGPSGPGGEVPQFSVHFFGSLYVRWTGVDWSYCYSWWQAASLKKCMTLYVLK